MPLEIIVLRLIHVLGGVLWVGSGLFSALFLVPALGDVGPSAGAVMGALQRRRMFVILPLTALLTILSGIRLMWITSAGFSAAYFASGRGATYTAAAVAALIAFLLGVFVMRPAAARAAALGAALRDAPDDATRQDLTLRMQRIQRRTATLNPILAGLLIFAAGGMAIARYVY